MPAATPTMKAGFPRQAGLRISRIPRMPLRRSPSSTPLALAARRRNALRSTGPRSLRGKACVSFNALKHGHYAARAPQFRRRLLAAGFRRGEELYGRIRSVIAHTLGARDAKSRQQADRLTASVWCCLGRPGGPETKLECALESDTKASRTLLPSMNWLEDVLALADPDGPSLESYGALSVEPEISERPEAGEAAKAAAGEAGAVLESLLGSILNPPRVLDRSRIQIHDGIHRLGLVFWVQARRRRTRARLRAVALGLARADSLLSRAPYEEGVRWRVHRLRRPCMDDRLRYGLDRDGGHHPGWVARGRRALRELGSWKIGPYAQHAREAGAEE